VTGLEQSSHSGEWDVAFGRISASGSGILSFEFHASVVLLSHV